MNTGIKAKALVVAAVLAGTVGLAGPASADTASGAAAALNGNWSTCTAATPMPNEPHSTGVACLNNYEGNLWSVATVNFKSPVPAAWTACTFMTYLEKKQSDGSWAWFTPGQKDCLSAATSSGATSMLSNTPAVAGTYRARIAIVSSYNGVVTWQYLAETTEITMS